jgi:hypothetical protein
MRWPGHDKVWVWDQDSPVGGVDPSTRSSAKWAGPDASRHRAWIWPRTLGRSTSKTSDRPASIGIWIM